MYASMLTLRILHGLCNALYLELSLRLTEVFKSVLLLCTDPPITELQLSRHFSPGLIPRHEVAALNIIVFLAFNKCFTHMLHL